MAESTQIFQFTLGPVQGFVAQARRTRDFWAGSFILSWLTGVAVECIQKQRGEVKFPVPDADYLRALRGELGCNDRLPQQGSIPNRFMATTAKVPADFQPQWVEQAVQNAWQALADAVWRQDLGSMDLPATREIWQRQVGRFWEISWVLSDAASAPSLLDRRKNWRDTVLPEEPGHKCMMMDGWQELSGVAETSNAKVDQFWERLKAQNAPGICTDLGDGERLCAVAFIKRRFARCFHTVEAELPGTLGKVGGWQVPTAVPSVAFLAAAPWLADTIGKAPPEAFERFFQNASAVTEASESAHVMREQAFEIDIRCVAEAARQRQGFKRHWAGLDGQVYFPTALENPRIFGSDQQPQARAVLRQLHALRQAAGQKDLPSPYYAILLMDGDQLGKHMGDEDKQTPISQALNDFTQAVGDIVRAHNGFLIYAGGDDVLALLPLEDALPAAAALQAKYRDLFAQHSPKGKPIDSTLSGAIEYVHFRSPLTRVLQDAHRLLDDVAKEQTGRNAIAVRVWKPSGMAAQWAMPWEKALDQGGQVVKLAQLAQEFARQGDDDAAFSSKFFFRMKQVLERFSDADQATLEKLLLAEYLHSWGDLGQRSAQPDTEQLNKQLNKLLDQCWQWQRPHAGAEAKLKKDAPLNPDAALLVRFLARKGLDKDQGALA
ncbi:type III-B CRISPR-associated protein Cas10/Cmr2 [Vandammella animalimorsus]|uniref:Type III-B CRISPR-associated protein Cas10/Cmr2 n=1 Tax=Vandammella animalimorsus TaxID=2029117 RepID=A0A2A2AD33_9BURK|nr:type III-B CRISPR-associated protein Cas10/Cmr2 [Vandammella animalimorsus]PAT36460.1 type III-B CRISPR-associated protein Cas10/Cmr2 [Vandammella animalimorsus]